MISARPFTICKNKHHDARFCTPVCPCMKISTLHNHSSFSKKDIILFFFHSTTGTQLLFGVYFFLCSCYNCISTGIYSVVVCFCTVFYFCFFFWLCFLFLKEEIKKMRGKLKKQRLELLFLEFFVSIFFCQKKFGEIFFVFYWILFCFG